MIQLTRLDRQEVTVNSDLIELIEARPDTTLRLTTGQSLVVRERMDEVVERIRAWRGSVLERAGLPAQLALLARPTLNQLAEDMIEVMDFEASEVRS
jgi:flagellar protein FlbD